MITVETDSKHRVILRDDRGNSGNVILQLEGEEALKLAHALMAEAEKALKQSGRVHEG